MPNDDYADYLSEVSKLVNQNVISEKTARIHLGSLRNGIQSEEIETENFVKSDYPNTGIRVARLVGVLSTLSALALVVIFFK